MPFSTVVIARNEAKTLPRLVKSLEEFQKRGGEIVVVDTGSTDTTPKIARELGCVVFEEGTRFIHTIDVEEAKAINDRFIVNNEQPIVREGDTLFDFSAARNYAASKATNDVVSMPDCDEMWTKLDLNVVEKAISNEVQRFEYNFVFSHDQYGAELVKFLHSKFYDRRAFKWVGIIHEVLAGEGKTHRFGEEHMKLEHWQNPSTNRGGYLKGLAVDCYRNLDNDRNSHYFARELMWAGRHMSAMAEFDRHIKMNKWQAEAAQSMIYTGDCCMSLGMESNALDWYGRAYHKDATRREALIRLATHYWKKNDHQHAAAYAAAALTIPWNAFYGNNAAEYAQIPHEILYWALWYLGDKEGSKKHWLKALSYQPKNQKYLNDAQFYGGLPKPMVSIVIPTLGREEKLQECLKLIKANADYEPYEIIVLRDDWPPNNTGVPKLVKQGVEQSKGELVFFLGNDCRPQPGFLRAAVMAMITQFPDLDGLIAINDKWCPWELATHWLGGKKLLPLIGGEFFHTGYHHTCCDDELTQRCKALGKYYTAMDCVVIHDHPVNQKRSMIEYDELRAADPVYAIAYNEENRQADRALFEKRKVNGFK